MRLSILCSGYNHPIRRSLDAWAASHKGRHEIEIVQKSSELAGGNILFLVSCHELIANRTIALYRKALVIHASDLPHGRGWSPHVWAVLEGRSELVVTLLEARESVDTGPIWAKRKVTLAGNELFDEINEKLFACELELMDFAIDHFDTIVPEPQELHVAPTYRRRTPEDSRIDPTRTIADQFNLLRVADPGRYPAFFDWRGQRYEITLRKVRGSREVGIADAIGELS